MIVIDVLDRYQHEDAEPLRESVGEITSNLSAPLEGARQRSLPIIYVNDNYGVWTAGRRELVEAAIAGDAAELVRPLLPPDDAPFVVLEDAAPG